MSVNKVILLGNLGSDPELHSSNDKQSICIFSLATDPPNNGTNLIQPEWHRIVCFGSLAENCKKYLKKGREVFVEGQIQTRRWSDKEGKEKVSNQILAHIVKFVGNHKDELPETSPSDEDLLPTSEDYITYEGEEEMPY